MNTYPCIWGFQAFPSQQCESEAARDVSAFAYGTEIGAFRTCRQEHRSHSQAGLHNTAPIFRARHASTKPECWVKPPEDRRVGSGVPLCFPRADQEGFRYTFPTPQGNRKSNPPPSCVSLVSASEVPVWPLPVGAESVPRCPLASLKDISASLENQVSSLENITRAIQPGRPDRMREEQRIVVEEMRERICNLRSCVSDFHLNYKAGSEQQEQLHAGETGSNLTVVSAPRGKPKPFSHDASPPPFAHFTQMNTPPENSPQCRAFVPLPPAALDPMPRHFKARGSPEREGALGGVDGTVSPVSFSRYSNEDVATEANPVTDSNVPKYTQVTGAPVRVLPTLTRHTTRRRTTIEDARNCYVDCINPEDAPPFIKLALQDRLP